MHGSVWRHAVFLACSMPPLGKGLPRVLADRRGHGRSGTRPRATYTPRAARAGHPARGFEASPSTSRRRTEAPKPPDEGPRAAHRGRARSRDPRVAVERRLRARPVWVEGEVTGARPAPSGHLYFCLKDEHEEASIDVVVYRSNVTPRMRALCVDGARRARCAGKPTFWAPRGRLQLIADRAAAGGARRAARGARAAQGEARGRGALRAGAQAPLPAEPRVIGVVTSAAGAVIHDICRVAFRRGGARILLAPAQVQGCGRGRVDLPRAGAAPARARGRRHHPRARRRLGGRPRRVQRRGARARRRRVPRSGGERRRSRGRRHARRLRGRRARGDAVAGRGAASCPTARRARELLRRTRAAPRARDARRASAHDRGRPRRRGAPPRRSAPRHRDAAAALDDRVARLAARARVSPGAPARGAVARAAPARVHAPARGHRARARARSRAARDRSSAACARRSLERRGSQLERASARLDAMSPLKVLGARLRDRDARGRARRPIRRRRRARGAVLRRARRARRASRRHVDRVEPLAAPGEGAVSGRSLRRRSGDPVAHSKSPAMHAAAYRALGLPHTYEAMRATAEELPRVVAMLRDGPVRRHQRHRPAQAARPRARRRDRSEGARSAGAANTLVRTADGQVVAHNTDAPALAAELRALGGPTRAWGDLRALVLGSGGAARAAIAALVRHLGVRDVVVRARAFAEDSKRAAFAAARSRSRPRRALGGVARERCARVDPDPVHERRDARRRRRRRRGRGRRLGRAPRRRGRARRRLRPARDAVSPRRARPRASAATTASGCSRGRARSPSSCGSASRRRSTRCARRWSSP